MPSPQVWFRAAVEAAAGCDAYPLDVPEGISPPYVVFERTGTARDTTLADSLDEVPAISGPAVATITASVYHDDYVAVWELADAVVAAVHGYAAGEILSSLVVEQADGSPTYLEGRDQATYAVDLTVEVTYQAAG